MAPANTPFAATAITHAPAHIELLGEHALTAQDLAHACARGADWVITHVEAGVITPSAGGASTEWRFASTTLGRARRIAQLEYIYDADPQLAALAVDLMEEVARLRRLLG